MYFYIPPISIIKESGTYVVLDQFGSKYNLGRDMLITYLSAAGKEANVESIAEELDDSFGIVDAGKLLEDLISNSVLIKSKYKRRDYFNYGRVARRIIDDDAREKDILNIGSVTFASSGGCPYQCSGCYVPLETFRKSKIQQISFDKVKQTLEDVALLGANNVTLSGGEITLSERDVQRAVGIAEIAKLNGAESLTLVTTGFRLGEFIDSFIKSGITEYQISLDGPASYNDVYKHFNGATDRAFCAIKTCQNKGLNYTVNTVVTKKNLDLIGDFIEDLVDNNVSNIRLAKVISSDDTLLLAHQEVARLRELIEQKKAKFRELNISGPFDNPYSMEGYLDCIAGSLYIHIDSLGNILPCGFMDARIIGNINQDRFLDIWNMKNPLLSKMSGGIELEKECDNCDERYNCFSNCIVEYEIRKSKCPKIN